MARPASRRPHHVAPRAEGLALNKWAIAAISLAITAVLAALALYLGAWAFDTKRYSTHETRLRHLVERGALLDQVTRGLEDEGSPLLGSPRSREDLEHLAKKRGRTRAPEIIEKGSRWPSTRVFLASDMIYFIYFDEAGVMRDFTCVGR